MLEPREAPDPLTEFFDGVRSPLTKTYYTRRLADFLDFAGAEGSTLQAKARDLVKRAKADPGYLEATVNAFLREQRLRVERGEIQASTIGTYKKPVRLFLEMNDLGGMVNWKKLARRLPQGRAYANDRAPTRPELLQLMSYADRRIRPLVLLMVSSGIRIGALEGATWGNLTPINRDGQVVAAKLLVYPGDREQYSTFISPEAYRELEAYVNFRKSQGENVGPSSPIFRDLFLPDKGARGLAHQPKALAASGAKRLLEDALHGTGLRVDLPEGKHRHEFQGAHGLRKAAKSLMERSMKSLNVEILLGHDVGLAESYYRPKEEELLDDYLKAVPDLTFFETPQAAPVDVGRIERLEKELADLQGLRDDLNSGRAFQKWVDSVDMVLRERGVNLGDRKLKEVAVEAFLRDGAPPPDKRKPVKPRD